MEKVIKKQNFSKFGLTIGILAFIVTIVNFIKNSLKYDLVKLNITASRKRSLVFIYLDFTRKDDIMYLTFVIMIKYKKGERFKDLSFFIFCRFEHSNNIYKENFYSFTSYIKIFYKL